MLDNRADRPADPVFADLFHGLDGPAVLGVLREQLQDEEAEVRLAWSSCRPIEALYDPGQHVCVAYALSADHETALERAWPEGHIVYLRHPVRRPMSRRGTVLEIAGHEVEVYRFPNDRRLRGMRKFAHRRSAATIWKHWLREDEPSISLEDDSIRRSLLRYVPEQKWIIQLRAQGHDAISDEPVKRALAVRCGTVADCRRMYHRILQLRRAMFAVDGAFQVPKPVALDSGLGLLAVRWAWGRPLVETLHAGDPAATMARVAMGLNLLHDAAVERLAVLTPDDHLVAAAQSLQDIVGVLPACRPLATAILDALAAGFPRGPGTLATIHNDFHWNQLRIKKDRFTVLDLERCARGDPAVDVASFVAQIAMLGVRPETGVSPREATTWHTLFLHAWEDTTRGPVDPERINWHSAISLLTLARGALRHLRPGWPNLVRACLDRALTAARSRGGGLLEISA